MALPSTVSYTLPDEGRESSRAPWHLEAERAALLVHDMQRYFTRVYSADCGAFHGALEKIARLLDWARTAQVPVVYTAQPGDQNPADRGLLTDLWGPGITGSEADTAIVGELAPRPGELVLVKHRYSAFARSKLEEWLRANGRDQLVVTGIYAHIGIVATATDAFMRDIEPFVVADAVADFSADDHVRALHQVAQTCGVVTTTAQLTEKTPSGSPWPAWLARELTDIIGDPQIAQDLVADPQRSFFAAGLDSMRTFTLLDTLADLGVDIDFVDFVGTDNTGYLLAAIERSGTPAP